MAERDTSELSAEHQKAYLVTAELTMGLERVIGVGRRAKPLHFPMGTFTGEGLSIEAIEEEPPFP